MAEYLDPEGSKMPVPSPVALVPDPEQTRELVVNRASWGRITWKPLHDRMDYGMIMYLLLDPVQQLKPVGMRRFVSNDPRTAIDSAVNILTRNTPFWRIDMPYDMHQSERAKVGKIERALSGIVDDLDSMFLERGEMNFWTQAAFFALARGAVWAKLQVTEDAIRIGRSSPLLGEFYDPRWVYPNFDGIGLESIVVEKQCTLNDLLVQYPNRMMAELGAKSIDMRQLDPNAPAVKLEYWSNNRETGSGIYGVLGYYSTAKGLGVGFDPITDAAGTGGGSGGSCWLVQPIYHGYRPEALPIVGVPVNGIPLKSKPVYGSNILAAMNQRARNLGLVMPSWHDQNSWRAEWGRGLLTSVEELMPQYNEMVATALQHFTIGTYGTWVFKTQSGELPEFEDGINGKVPLRIGEDAQRFEPAPINADAYRILDILREEKQRGTLNGILQAQGSNQANSGIVLQQSINTALNNLNPFGTGLTNFGSVGASHLLEQLKLIRTGPLHLVSRGSKSFFRITFDPHTDLEDRKYKPEPIFRPSVPEDILLKAQVARLLLDPRMPIMSVVTVLDKIFQLDDPEGETNRMLEDIANRDPILLLDRVAGILEEAGEQEMADRIRQKEFQAQYQEKAAMLNLQAQMQQLMAMMQGTDPMAQSAGRTDAGVGGYQQTPEGTGLAGSSGAADATGGGSAVRPGQGGGGGGGPDMSALASIGGGV